MIQISNLIVQVGRRTVLNGISFDLEKGNFLAVLGPNGGGKSTLLRTILGLIPEFSGSIRILSGDGQPIPKIGYVPQIKSLDRTFPAFALELVVTSIRGRWPAWISRTERSIGMTALESVGAKHLANQPIGTLSGGELQRIYLAKALIHEPELLLLDEPETGIDASGTSDLYALLDNFRMNTGGLVMMVTHDWDVAYHHATHVLLLNNKQISFGTPKEALNGDAVRNAFGHIGHEHAMLAGQQ